MVSAHWCEFELNQKKYEAKFEAAVNKRKAYPQGSAMYDKMQEKVSEYYDKMYSVGYFRDNYNGYGLSANLNDFSWWRDVCPLLGEDGNLTPEKARVVYQMVKNAKIDLTRANEVAAQQKDTPPKVEDYEKFRQELLDFLQHAIDTNQPICASL